jgi:hypothetical protein
MDQYGLDPWASPENAVKAAAIHLSNDFKATGGNVAETAARYIAGTAGKRGRVTAAYVNRVTNAFNQLGGAGAAPAAAVSPDAPPPQDAVPDLPPPPAPVQAPVFGDQVRSARLEMAQRLLNAPHTGVQSSVISSMADPFFEKGLTEDQNIREQRAADIVARQNIGYQSDRNLYNTQATNIQEAKIAERTATIASNRAKENEYQKHVYTLQEQAAQDAAALKRAEATHAGALKAPAPIQKDYLGFKSITDRASRVMELIKAHPEFSNITYGQLPEILKSRTDPDGIATRAALNELNSYLLQKRSGSAVTESEYARQKGWLPADNDTMGGALTKLQQMQLGYSGDMENIRRLYTDPTTGRSMFDVLDTPSAATGSGTPVGTIGATKDSGGWSVTKE